MKTRFCPSPTGDIHIGNLRTALFNVLLAKHDNNGTFLLRIEDTDQKRSSTKHIKSLVEDLQWLNLEWDEGIEKNGAFGPYKQSLRNDIYQKYYDELLKKGYAYYCFCSDAELKESRKKTVGAR